MLFQSFDFLVFLIAIVGVYWRLPRRGQNVLLLVGSVIFYGWVHPWFLLLLLTSTVVDYLAARGLGGSEGRRREVAKLSRSASVSTSAKWAPASAG